MPCKRRMRAISASFSRSRALESTTEKPLGTHSCLASTINAERIRRSWLEDGSKGLDYMEADERFNTASFNDSLEEQGVVADQNDLTKLIENMRSLTKRWRRSIGEHGELVFYIDAC